MRLRGLGVAKGSLVNKVILLPLDHQCVIPWAVLLTITAEVQKVLHIWRHASYKKKKIRRSQQRLKAGGAKSAGDLDKIKG